MGRGWGQYKPEVARLGLEGRFVPHLRCFALAPTKVAKTIPPRTPRSSTSARPRSTCTCPDQVLPRDLSRPPDPLPAAAVGRGAERIPRARPTDRRRGPRLDPRRRHAHPGEPGADRGLPRGRRAGERRAQLGGRGAPPGRDPRTKPRAKRQSRGSKTAPTPACLPFQTG